MQYSFKVTNPGAVTLVNVSISDPMLANLGIAVTCLPDVVLPVLSILCTSGPYTITAADVAASRVDNVAMASATPPSQTPVQSGESVAGLQLSAPPSPTSTPTSTSTSSGRPVARTGVHAATEALVGLMLVGMGATTLRTAHRRRQRAWGANER